ncbi:E3 ubiquitin/ISG15 ligase TRIM25 [Merluccius polli]|uniref:E3 ubiquitin/ISG15 ligase TRIM25 n=1 Tax=Merluccius polli TaxID=89951 RepID=A0AA47N6C9_MERPO|nr:E3 ubiquitin/ISG15 ligase TRIM25 [Merluccius polli]
MDDDREKTPLEVLLTCPVCQDLFTEPRQLQCGHSICMACLESMVGHSAELPFRCPDCRAYFGKVVEVQKSYVLASIVDDFKETMKQTARKAAKVYCDCCPDNDDNKTLAVKTCLKCEVSLCSEHVRTHLERRAFAAHPLVSPLVDLPDRKCPQHEDQVLRYYCAASRRYACNVCALEGKRSALVTDAASALGRRMTEYMDQRFQMIEGKMTESLDSINKLQDTILNDKVKRPSDSSLNSVTLVLLCLWIIVLSYSYNFFLENQTLTDTVKSQQTRLHNIYSTIAESLAENPLHLHENTEKKYQASSPSRRSSNPFRLHPKVLTLDLQTASPHLQVSGDLRSVERVQARLDYPILDARFDDTPQVLSTQCFGPGHHLWIVKAEGHWEIACGVPRKGGGSAFGVDPQSWSIAQEGAGGPLYAAHQGVRTELPGTAVAAVGVWVNSQKGTVTFYGNGTDGGAVHKLHEFQAQLSGPVCLGLGLHSVEPPSRARIMGYRSLLVQP